MENRQKSEMEGKGGECNGRTALRDRREWRTTAKDRSWGTVDRERSERKENDDGNYGQPHPDDRCQEENSNRGDKTHLHW